MLSLLVGMRYFVYMTFYKGPVILVWQMNSGNRTSPSARWELNTFKSMKYSSTATVDRHNCRTWTDLQSIALSASGQSPRLANQTERARILTAFSSRFGGFINFWYLHSMQRSGSGQSHVCRRKMDIQEAIPSTQP